MRGKKITGGGIKGKGERGWRDEEGGIEGREKKA